MTVSFGSGSIGRQSAWVSAVGLSFDAFSELARPAVGVSHRRRCGNRDGLVHSHLPDRGVVIVGDMN